MSGDWHFLVALNERLRLLRDPVEIQDVAVQLIGEHLQASRVHYAQIEGDEFVVRRSYADAAALPFPDRGPMAHFGKAVVDACERNETVAVEDAGTDPRFTDAERAQFLSSGTGAFLCVPLTKGGRWLATFSVHAATPRSWTRDQIALTEVIAERTGGASERAPAEEALSRQAFLTQLNDTIRPLADPARVLDAACRRLGTHMHVNRVVYAEVDGDECTVVNDYVDGVPSMTGRFPWADLVGSRTEEILPGGTLLANDTSIEPHTVAEREALRAAGIGAYLCPLLVKGGRFVGAFGVHSREPRVWTTEERALVQDVADRIWATLEHRKAEADLHANEERLAFLLRLNDAFRPLSDPGDVREIAARLLGQHVGANRVSYAEFNGGQYEICREYTSGVPSRTEEGHISLGGELREALRHGGSVVVNDAQTDPRLTDGNRASLQSRHVAAFVWTTLYKNGRMVASLGVSQVTPRAWTESETLLVRDVAERTWDAVERTRTEAALRDQQNQLRLALEASAGASWTWIAATNQVHWDDRFRPLYGFAADEPASSEAWLSRVHEDDRPRLLALREEMWTSRTKESWEITYRIVRPDGTVAWIQSRGRVDRDADGNATRLTGLDLDFTHHHRTEEALQARRDEEHDRALRTLLETASQGIVSVDASGLICTANPALEGMFGWSAGELIGHGIEELLPATFRDAHARHRIEYFAAPRARLLGGELGLVGKRKDGSTFPIEVSLNHVQTPGGDRAFAFVTDITDRQRAAAALRERTAELEYRTTQLSRMASDLTLAERRAREQIARTLHDGLQQMLVISALNLEQQLQRDSEAGAAQSELLSEAKHQLEEAIGAARSLNVELFPPVLQHAGLPAALRWLANWTHDKYKLPVHVVADPRADSGRKDVRTLLFESVRELLFNAVKHAQADSATLELALDDDDQLCITVSDQGVGFEREGLAHRSEGGQVGWGLFSIRERLTLLGGRFELDSAPGKGTRIRLVAPRGAAQPAVAGRAISTDTPAGAISVLDDGRSAPDALRILIVDDHAAVRGALRDMLNAQPELSVVGDASNGFEAIASAHTLRPDVILMDIAMPHMDGIEATSRIRAELPDIQVLGLSMQPRSAAAAAMEQAGAAGFFVKGIEMQRLVEHLLAVHASRGAGHPAALHADPTLRRVRG
jgi:PAS domain S-box-containing protein